MDLREQAQNLRQRLNEPAVDIERLAHEAVGLFAAAGRGAHHHWLQVELQGYGASVDHAPLSEVIRANELGPYEGPRLVAHVSAYRAQPGTTVETPTRPFRHFFVESIHDLSVAAYRFRDRGAQTLRLEFSIDVPNYPAAGIFPSDVFDRVLLGFRAALHLQLGIIAA